MVATFTIPQFKQLLINAKTMANLKNKSKGSLKIINKFNK